MTSVCLRIIYTWYREEGDGDVNHVGFFLVLPTSDSRTVNNAPGYLFNLSLFFDVSNEDIRVHS